MTPHVAFWTALLAGGALTGDVGHPSGSLTGVEVVPSTSRTEVILEVSGEVGTRDFTMDGPARLVLDLVGARHELPGESFDDVRRGGIRRISASQYDVDVVRVVLELETLVGYALIEGAGFVRISLENPTDPNFEPWSARGVAQPTGLGAPAVHAASGPADSAAGSSSSAASASPPMSGQELAQRFSVNFTETPIREVLFTFADFSGRSIVPGSGISGNVNAEIRDQPWDIALHAILESHGLAASEMESGIIRVDRLEELSRRAEVEQLVTRPFRIQYAVAADFQAPIQSLLSDRGRIAVTRSTNSVIVTDIPRVLEQVEQLINGMDIETPEITISAKIIFVNRTDLEEFGVIYDLKDSRGNQINQILPGGTVDEFGEFEMVPTGTNVVSLGGNSIAALGNANQRVASPAVRFLTSLVIGRHTLLSFVEALSSVNLSDIQASPQLRVLENERARILVGERTPIRVIDVGTGAGAQTQFPRASVQLEETGIILEVTPQVTAGNMILLQLRAERSGIEIAETDIGVIFNTQEAETRVLVMDGETVVIGGLTVTELTEVRAGIPLLKDLPLVGRFFRLTREQRNQRDLMILVTPQINRR